jgi:hypothetical protein
MNINELFEKIQDRFIPEELNGEFTLHGNCIIWEYNLDDDSEEIEIPNFEDADYEFDFESTSPEELLQEAYNKDKEVIDSLLDELEETDNWSFSEPDVIKNTITYKIF